jgi:hypothetical protein
VKGYYSKLDVVAVVKFDDKLNARRSSLSKEVNMPRVSYFAVPADNPERATKFYRQVLDGISNWAGNTTRPKVVKAIGTSRRSTATNPESMEV